MLKNERGELSIVTGSWDNDRSANLSRYLRHRGKNDVSSIDPPQQNIDKLTLADLLEPMQFKTVLLAACGLKNCEIGTFLGTTDRSSGAYLPMFITAQAARTTDLAQ